MAEAKFYDAISKIFTTSKILGVFPLRNRYPFSKLFNQIPVLLLLSCLACEGYFWYEAPGVSPWDASSTGWYFKLVSQPPFTYAVLSHVLIFRLKSPLTEVFAKLAAVEKSLERVSGVCKYEHARRQWKVLVFMVMVKVFNLCGIQNCWTFNWSYRKILNLLIHVIGRVSLVVIQMQFATIVQAMRDQILTMANIVKTQLNSHPVSTETVEEIVRIYNELCSVCPTVNSFYTNQLLGIITMDYINININAYRIVTYFTMYFAKDEQHSLFWLFVRFMGFIQSVIVLLLIVGACVSLQKSIEDLNKSLYRQIISGANPQLQHNEILCAHLSLRRIPSFTACSLVRLNYEMIYSVCSSNVTFIVLALQVF